jgi:uncharacterized protein (TIGR02246 family)
MNRVTFYPTAMLLAVMATATAHGAEGVSAPAEVPGVQAFLDAYSAAYNRGDAAAVARLWAADAQSIDIHGNVTEGREAIQESFAAMFAKRPGAKLAVRVLNAKSVNADVAVVDVAPQRAPDAAEPAPPVQTAMVLERAEAGWMIHSARDTLLYAMGSTHLERLAWMIGSWRGATEGPEPTRLSVHCDWTGNRSFLVRTYTLERAGVRRHGHEIIAWDAAEKTIRSWLFDSSGGFAERTWRPEKAAWEIVHRATTAEGSRHESTDLLTPIDADTFKVEWQTDTEANLRDADAHFVVVRRVKAEALPGGPSRPVLPQ